VKLLRLSLGGLVAVVAALLLRTAVAGPTPVSEHSIACNFQPAVFEVNLADADDSVSQCIILKRTDNWYYLVGEFGWFVGDDSAEGPMAFAKLIEGIEAGSFDFSSAYGVYCVQAFARALNQDQAELITISESDPNGQFSMTCPAEET
jgi:hypothetical protein